MIKLESTPQFNVDKLTKAQLSWLGKNYCKHRMPYISHPSCFFREKPNQNPIQERIGFLDIEEVVRRALDESDRADDSSIEALEEADAAARKKAAQIMEQMR